MSGSEYQYDKTRLCLGIAITPVCVGALLNLILLWQAIIQSDVASIWSIKGDFTIAIGQILFGFCAFLILIICGLPLWGLFHLFGIFIKDEGKLDLVVAPLSLLMLIPSLAILFSVSFYPDLMMYVAYGVDLPKEWYLGIWRGQ